MKIGLFGIHYLEHLKHWCLGDLRVDYELLSAKEKNNKNLYENHDITFYGSTYFSDKLNNLINDYNFKSLKLNTIDNKKEDNLGNNWTKRNKRFKEVIKLILEDNIEYDFVILTRFDIIFNENIYKLNINYNKINLVCKSVDNNSNIIEIDDNFYLLPYNQLQIFYDIINNINEQICSHQYFHFIDINNLNFIVDNTNTNRDKLYELLRFAYS